MSAMGRLGRRVRDRTGTEGGGTRRLGRPGTEWKPQKAAELLGKNARRMRSRC